MRALEGFLHVPRTSLDDIEKWLDAKDLGERAGKPGAKTRPRTSSSRLFAK